MVLAYNLHPRSLRFRVPSPQPTWNPTSIVSARFEKMVVRVGSICRFHVSAGEWGEAEMQKTETTLDFVMTRENQRMLISLQVA